MTILCKSLGQKDYRDIFAEMKSFTENRTPETPDEIWFLEHDPVYTQGQAGKPEHILFANNIPIVQSDRGGQVTYHGPGQLIVYPLLQLKRYGLSIRSLVTLLEDLVIHVLSNYQISANSRQDAPGVYVDGKKIASIGLRIKRGCSYHGLSFNIDMDLSPFQAINPCGFQALEMTQLSELVNPLKKQEVMDSATCFLLDELNKRLLENESLA